MGSDAQTGEEPLPAAPVDIVEIAPDEVAGDASGAEDTPTAASDPAQTQEATDDPTALGSAFHAAAQWLIETGSASVPAERIEALARLWRISPAQHVRLEEALARWSASRVRCELRAWPVVRAEVPFFCRAPQALAEHGAYAEGAIDALATDPARPGHALVIDYKTGGSPAETAEMLHAKHALQAEVYARVLGEMGFDHVSLRFVRVEVPDPQAPAEPEVVSYEF